MSYQQTYCCNNVKSTSLASFHSSRLVQIRCLLRNGQVMLKPSTRLWSHLIPFSLWQGHSELPSPFHVLPSSGWRSQRALLWPPRRERGKGLVPPRCPSLICLRGQGWGPERLWGQIWSSWWEWMTCDSASSLSVVSCLWNLISLSILTIINIWKKKPNKSREAEALRI